jgi:hypothetical protein
METPLNSFDYANHSQKQQKARTFLMLTVISVLQFVMEIKQVQSPNELAPCFWFL